MKVEPVSGGRATVRDTGSALEVIIPAQRRALLAAFLTVWLAGWAVGAATALGGFVRKHPLRAPPGFLALWLTVWMLGGVFAAFALIWTVFGRERLTLTEQYLDVRREALGLGRGWRYDLANVKDLRASGLPSSTMTWGSGGHFWSYGGGGQIAFDYGPKTVRFGATIDEAEAKQIVAQLVSRNAWLRRSKPPG
jgi:hypothetical protein